MSEPKRACKDCGSTTRPLPHPGPRDATCWRAEQKRRKADAHEKRVQDTYGLPPGQYEVLYEAQGRQCALKCGATGKTKRLAVDHDHKCCPGKTSCGKCVRGLLCSKCNSALAHFRDDPNAFGRAMNYLIIPPARAVLCQSLNSAPDTADSP